MSITIDELRDFLRFGPPRSVPSKIRKKTLRRVPWFLILFGTFFGLFGSVFLVIFFPWRIADDSRLGRSAHITTDAVVLARLETNMRENEVRVYRYEFSYTTENGIAHTGVCYQTGGSIASGSRATVEYLPNQPEIARIKGCRLSAFGWGGGFVILFPLVGFGMVFFTIRARRRLLRLLTHGRFSSGKIESVEVTNVRVNNQMRYKVKVSFKDDFADRTTHYSAYGNQVTLAQEKRDSGATVGILYDPSNPTRVLLVDELLSP